MAQLAQAALFLLGGLAAADGLDMVSVALGWRRMSIDEWMQGGSALAFSYHAPLWLHGMMLVVGVCAMCGAILWMRKTNREIRERK